MEEVITWGNALNANMDLLDTAVNKAMPTGGIIMWSGTIATIPTGWALCDGTNGTPNLTGKFIVHADADSSGTYNVGATGGANDVTLTTSQMPAHNHSGSTASAGSHTHSASTNSAGAHSHTTNISFSPDVDYFGNNVSILNNGQNGTNSVGGQSTDFTSIRLVRTLTRSLLIQMERTLTLSALQILVVVAHTKTDHLSMHLLIL